MTARPEYAEARQRGLANSTAAHQTFHPEHLPRVLADRAKGLTYAEIGKKWGVGGSTVRAFLARMGQ